MINIQKYFSQSEKNSSIDEYLSKDKILFINEYLLSKLNNKKFKTVIATDKNIRQLVQEAIKENGIDVDLNFIDVSQVTNMYALFEHSDFCGDISAWDVSNVTNMSSMFYGARMFNCDISEWDVSKVENFESMFQGAEVFNQPIGKWKTEKATNMVKMFYWASHFDQDLSNWNVDNVQDRTMMLSCSLTGRKKDFWPKFKD